MIEWIEVNGAALRYELHRSGDRPTIVLLHEIGGAIESWDASVDRFFASFNVLRYDQRGFGQSEKAVVLTIEGIVKDLAALLDALDLDSPCHFAGGAMGAGIAIAFAQAYPERVLSLAVASPALGYPPDTPLTTLENRAALVEQQGVRATADLGFERSYPLEIRGASFAAYRLRWLGNDPRGIAAISRVASRMYLVPRLAELHCPVLVMGCTHDLIRPSASSAAIAEMIPCAEFVEIDAGHFSAVQNPSAFANAALSFFSRTSANAAPSASVSAH